MFGSGFGEYGQRSFFVGAGRHDVAFGSFQHLFQFAVYQCFGSRKAKSNGVRLAIMPKLWIWN
jgi:hypothetical protein